MYRRFSRALLCALLCAVSVLPARSIAATPIPAAARAPVSAPAPAPLQRGKTLYELGVLLGASIEDFDLSEVEFAQVRAGMADVLHHRADLDAAQAYRMQIQELHRTRVEARASQERQRGERYLARAAGQPGARRTASGLLYVPLVAGSGDAPGPADRVQVNYEGRLIDGTIFDSSYARGQPASFNVGGVIPCWTEALQLMKAGGKARIVCPADLAYGDRAAGPKIKPGATLVFDIELLDVMHASPPPPPPPPPPSPASPPPAAAVPPAAAAPSTAAPSGQAAPGH